MSIYLPWLAVLVLLPLAEIYVMIKVGGLIGAIPTIALIVFTAVLGSLLMRYQGLSTLARVRSCMERGEAPAGPLLEGLVLLIGGLLLLLPGFITDVIGLLALIPPLRRWGVRRFLRGALARSIPPHPPGQGGSGPPGGHHTIEGEYRREE